jgi:hypothetical protein
MTARTILQASAPQISTYLRRPTHFIIERPTIIDIYNARISHCLFFSCCFHYCSCFRCSSPVCCHLHRCDDPADLLILNSYFNARSNDAGAPLSARDKQARRDIPQKLNTRASSDSLERSLQARNFLEDVLGVDIGTTLLGILRRKVTPDQFLANRNNAEDFIKSISSRDSNSEQRMQARNTLDDLLAIWGSTFFRRDVAPGDWEDLVKMLNTRELSFKRDIQARNLFTSILALAIHKLMSLPIHLRDLTPDKFAGRNSDDDFINNRTPNHATREPSPKQKTQAARDRRATNAFIKALLNSREPSREVTTDKVTRLALLASRALNELD